MFSLSVVFLLILACFLEVSASFCFVCIGAVLSVSMVWWGTLSLGLLSLGLMVDQLSGNMVLLSLLVAGISIISGYYEGRLFCLLVLASTFSSVCFFMVSDLVSFFVFFEVGLIPLLLLILSWGYQPERLQACMCLVLYTVVGSLPLFMLICGFYLMLNCGYMMVVFSELVKSGLFLGEFLWFFVMLGFLVKLPVFGVHGWLPKAHVEAPAAGSIILAGVLLKFGGYGMMRMMWCFYWVSSTLTELMMSVGVWGGLLSAFICLIQSDLKSLIAYSSVSHMSLVLVGIMSCSVMGWSAALMMMVAHGFSSSVLFGLANWSYGGFNSRSVLICKGLLQISPMISIFWFLGVVLSMGLPPGINFISEFSLISSGYMSSYMFLIPLMVICFITAGYSLYLYSMVTHGGSGGFLFSSFVGSGDLLSLALGELFLLESFVMVDIFYLL